MAQTPTTDHLLDDIDLRQTELLWRLDELNDRVEQTLRSVVRGQASGQGPVVSGQ